MGRILHPLFALLASVTRQELARQIAYLKEENRILRARLNGATVARCPLSTGRRTVDSPRTGRSAVHSPRRPRPLSVTFHRFIACKNTLPRDRLHRWPGVIPRVTNPR